MAQMTENFKTEGFVEQMKELDGLMMSNPSMEKKVKRIIRKVLGEVKKNIGRAAKEAMSSDPRQAYKAVRTSVYKRILGGNVNILQKKHASSTGGKYTPTRTIKGHQRGGNRRERTERTMMLESYTGADRSFVLRFINAGTQGRSIKKFTVKEDRQADKWNKHPNTGYRGRITPRNFFGNRSQQEMENAANKLQMMIDELIRQEIKT